MLFNKIIKNNKDLNNKEDIKSYNEFDVCNYFLRELVRLGKDESLFKIEKRCDRYLSLVYGNNDFLRVHIGKTDNTEWITIAMYDKNRKDYLNSELFLAQTNKNQIHWKANIDNFSDYNKFINIAYKACFVLKIAGEEPLTKEEEKIGDYLKTLYIECGAKKEDVYFRHLSDHAEIYYIEWPSTIKFKVYKKKNNCIWLFSDIAKKLHIKCETDGKIEFSKIEELDIIKPYILERIAFMNEQKQFYTNFENEYENLITNNNNI